MYTGHRHVTMMMMMMMGGYLDGDCETSANVQHETRDTTYSHKIPPCRPVRPQASQRLQMRQVLPIAVDEETLIQWRGKEKGGQGNRRGGIEQAEGPVPHLVPRITGG